MIERADIERTWRNKHAQWRRVFFDHRGEARERALDQIENDMQKLHAKAVEHGIWKRRR